jgi:hypothetical protein
VKIYGYNMDGKLINLPDWLIYSPFFLPGFGNVADTGAAYCRTKIGFGWIRNGKSSIVYYGTLLIFGFLKKKTNVRLNTKSLFNLFASLRYC